MPPTPKPAESAIESAEVTVDPQEAPKSRQAQFATYKEVDVDTDERPPPGPLVEQTLGDAKED